MQINRLHYRKEIGCCIHCNARNSPLHTSSQKSVPSRIVFVAGSPYTVQRLSPILQRGVGVYRMSSIEILLVEDNPGDVRLTIEALKEGKVCNNLNVVHDGTEAMSYLHQEGQYAGATRPDLILLDLNLPGKDGRDVLSEVKVDRDLKRIPVVVLTTSAAEQDILRTYDLHANCYITKPVDLEQFIKIVQNIQNFWFNIVKLPPR